MYNMLCTNHQGDIPRKRYLNKTDFFLFYSLCFLGFFVDRGENMKIIKKINTSAALALDSKGNEVVVLGKGIGFPKMPYDLKDLSVIEKTFYDLDPKYVEAIADLPQSILLASTEICELAQMELDCKLNPNLPITLADHLNFAIERFKKGIIISSPLAYDISHLYPKETDIGKQTLKILKETYDIILPEDETINIAMHVINAEIESGDLHSLMTTVKIIDEIVNMIEETMGRNLDQNSYCYSRFAMHMRYLIQRLSSGKQLEHTGS